MKKIIEDSINECGMDLTQDSIKLRVRGRGSGYKEGLEKMGKKILLIFF